MEAQKVDLYLVSNAKYFDSDQIPMIRESLLMADDSKFSLIQSINLKDPTILLVVSLLAGSLGIDRFLLGEVGLGIAKLLTCGGLGIWTIVDWFLIMGHTRETNAALLQNRLMGS